MIHLTTRDVFEPPTIPRCIVKIQDFDDEQTLQENIRDYVITETVASASTFATTAKAHRDGVTVARRG